MLCIWPVCKLPCSVTENLWHWLNATSSLSILFIYCGCSPMNLYKEHSQSVGTAMSRPVSSELVAPENQVSGNKTMVVLSGVRNPWEFSQRNLKVFYRFWNWVSLCSRGWLKLTMNTRLALNSWKICLGLHLGILKAILILTLVQSSFSFLFLSLLTIWQKIFKRLHMVFWNLSTL